MTAFEDVEGIPCLNDKFFEEHGTDFLKLLLYLPNVGNRKEFLEIVSFINSGTDFTGKLYIIKPRKTVEFSNTINNHEAHKSAVQINWNLPDDNKKVKE